MAIKMIIPPDEPGTTEFTTVGKMVQVEICSHTKQIEWQPMNAALKKGEAEYIAKCRKIKGKIPVTRYQNIKTAKCEGLEQGEILRRYRGQQGYSISEIKAVSAALSRFNNWKHKQ